MESSVSNSGQYNDDQMLSLPSEINSPWVDTITKIFESLRGVCLVIAVPYTGGIRPSTKIQRLFSIPNGASRMLDIVIQMREPNLRRDIYPRKKLQRIIKIICLRMKCATMVGENNARSSQHDYGEQEQIRQVFLNYRSENALSLYTEDTCAYRILNRSLRQQRLDMIDPLRQFMIDIINLLRRCQPTKEDSVSLTLYRGQQMTVFELDNLKKHLGEVVSLTSFFSTSMELKIAQIFAGDGSNNDSHMISVIVKILLDTSAQMRPYALINNSAEDEVLFSPSTKFVLNCCQKLHKSGRFWLVKLTAITEEQQTELEIAYGQTFQFLNAVTGMTEAGHSGSIDANPCEQRPLTIGLPL